jgi:hypothetical protein
MTVQQQSQQAPPAHTISVDIALVLRDMGPACARTAVALRNVLQEFVMEETQVASLLRFFCDRDDWNLTAVKQVLAEYSAALHWIQVARGLDAPNVSMTSATFSTWLDLYQAGAQAPPPLSVFVDTWRNAQAQLGVLECMASTTLYVVVLNEEETKDASVSSVAQAAFWASADILQRLLQLSDHAPLYRRVRDFCARSCDCNCEER